MIIGGWTTEGQAQGVPRRVPLEAAAGHQESLPRGNFNPAFNSLATLNAMWIEASVNVPVVWSEEAGHSHLAPLRAPSPATLGRGFRLLGVSPRPVTGTLKYNRGPIVALCYRIVHGGMRLCNCTRVGARVKEASRVTGLYLALKTGLFSLGECSRLFACSQDRDVS
ncbi:hypothetical protein Desmu_0719 [Desulfurococcus mucosus DSM 2162]|uniref:Uncharacterized protein n=1 Tax=Desulfurococcus mucosus (strain ATCC 35584 / DSM 2162 / JCM 9187 / O7/1) TaxID=765177 RepID=E8R949_DESM0|nr:hypothetical protein Desmu_0719 [Desulfurococcus mucosus DSM 2162]